MNSVEGGSLRAVARAGHDAAIQTLRRENAEFGFGHVGRCADLAYTLRNLCSLAEFHERADVVYPHVARERMDAVYRPRSREIRTLTMKAAQFRRALADLELNQGEAADLFGLSLRTISDYVNGHAPIPKPIAILTNLLVGGAVTLDLIDAVQ
jgi:hypothetical protein